MTIKELNEKRTALFEKISAMREAFNKQGQAWREGEAEKWQAVNEQYDTTMSALEVNQRGAKLDREMNATINPHNIGLDDAGDGRVGTRPAPGGHNSGHVRSAAREYVVSKSGKKTPLFARGDSMAAAAAKRKPELAAKYSGFAIGDFIRAVALGPRNSRERNALSSTLGSAGGYTIPEILSADLIDLMRAKSRVMEAGAKTFTMESADQLFAKLTADPSPSWLHEGAEMTETAPTFGQIRFTARTLRMLVKVPRELLEDSINLNGKLPTIFAAAMAGELDRVALLGSGEGAEPLGVLNFTDINSVSMGDNGAELADYSPLIDAIYEIEVDNAETPTTAIMHPRTKSQFSKLEDTTGQPLSRPDEIKAMRFLSTSKLSIVEDQGTATGECSSIVVGGFQELLIGMRSGLRVLPLEQRFAENNMIGFAVFLRADVGAFNENSLCKIIGIKA